MVTLKKPRVEMGVLGPVAQSVIDGHAAAYGMTFGEVVAALLQGIAEDFLREHRIPDTAGKYTVEAQARLCKDGHCRVCHAK